MLDRDHKPKKLVLAASEDAHSLNAVVNAARRKIISPVLVGDREKTFGMAEILNLDISKYEFIESQIPWKPLSPQLKWCTMGKLMY